MKCRAIVPATAGVALLGMTATALAADVVNVYSYRQPYLVEPLFEAFTRDTGIEVKTVFSDEGILERLRREGANSPADLVMTVDIGRLTDLKEAGVTRAVDSEVIESNIPANFRDPEDHWFGLTSRARIIVASKERVGEGEIASYEDLADPAWQGRVCTRSGKHAYMVALIASMILDHGEEGAREWLEGIKANLARTPQGNDRAQVKAISEGVCDVAVINHYYMAAMLEDDEQRPWAESVFMIFPNQDDRGTHMNVSGVVMTASAPHPDTALKLMEFLSGDDAQRIYAETNNEYPLKPGIERSELLASWGDFKTDDAGLAEIAALRNEAVKLADVVGYDE